MSDKVLFVGVYRDSTGWGHAARDYILALDAAGVEIVPRPLKLHPEMSMPPARILELEKRSSAGCDAVILHTLPHHMEYNGHFKKNIGLFASETDSFRYSHWPEHLNLMDEAWVINNAQQEAATRSGVTKPLRVVPHACDITRFQRAYKPLENLKSQLDGNFIFYTIGELVRRKNLPALIKAFHLEFHPSEPVSLVIKAGRAGMSPDEAAKHIGAMCDDIKASLKLYRNIHSYHRECVMTQRYSDEDILRLHASCDCFVSPSFGEAWCAIPGTLVDTSVGPRPIEDVKFGDQVVTHLGEYREVTQWMSRYYEGEIVKVKPHGISEELCFTPEHPHYVVKRNGKKYYRDVKINPVFEKAGRLEVGDFWVVPKLPSFVRTLDSVRISDFVDVKPNHEGRIECKHSYQVSEQESITEIAQKIGCSFQFVSKVLNGKAGQTELAKRVTTYINEHEITRRSTSQLNDEVQLTSDFMFFIGHYLAEGWSEQSTNNLATHASEWLGKVISLSAIKKAFGLEGTVMCRGNKSRLVFNNSIVSKFLRSLCGEGATQKFVHPVLKESKYVESLIRGFFYGDGCFSRKTLSMSTVSQKLSRDIVEMCNRLGIFIAVSLEKRENRKTCYNLKVVSQHHRRFFDSIKPAKYNEEVVCPSFDGQRFLIEDDKAFYLPIQSVRREPYKGMVYNLSVREHESYTVFGYATHNCIPAFDAMAMGKTPIVTATGGFLDYVSEANGWLVPGRQEPVFGERDTFNDLFTGYENWTAIDVGGLRRAMREAYEDDVLRRKKAEAGIDRAYDFTYEKVGSLLKTYLSESIET